MKTSIITTSLILLLPAICLSAEQDTAISLVEIQARDTQRFGKLDLDDDGHISLKEFEKDEAPITDRHKNIKRKERPHYRRAPARKFLFSSKRKGGIDSARANAHHKELFSILDKDQNQSLTQQEFLAAAFPKNHRLAQKRASFRYFDSNKDGKLSRSELPSRAKRLATLDSDNDGFISNEEMAKRATRNR